MAPEGTANPQRWAELAIPDERPSGDCNTEEGRGHLERYWVTILQGLKRGARKAMSITKPSEVIQRESESPWIHRGWTPAKMVIDVKGSVFCQIKTLTNLIMGIL